MEKYIVIYISALCVLLTSRSLYAQKISADQILNEDIHALNENDKFQKIQINSVDKKYLIIDFWATWCKPCIENHQTLENIWQKNVDSLAIITISGDNYKNFSRYNQTWKTNSMKALDSGGYLFKKLGIRIIPTIILINKETKGIQVISNRQISENAFLDFKKRKLNTKDSISKLLEPEEVLTKNFKGRKQISSFIETPAIPHSSSFILYSNKKLNLDSRTIYVNFSVPGVYREAYHMTEVRAIYDHPQSFQSYSCFELTVLEKDRNKVNPEKMIIDSLEKNHSEIKASIVKRPADSCYVLEKINQSSNDHNGSKTNEEYIQGNHFIGKGVNLSKVSVFLEEQLRVPVENEADSDGVYDIDLQYNYNGIEEINLQLSKIGLRLRLEKNKMIKYLLFEKKSK